MSPPEGAALAEMLAGGAEPQVRRRGRRIERPAFRATARYFAPRATGFRATRDER